MKVETKNYMIVTILMIVLSIVTSVTGLFYVTGGKPYDFINQYGDVITLYGDGLYAYDSLLRAPVFKGTDFTILTIGIPLLIIGLIWYLKKHSVKSEFFLASMFGIFWYYATSISFGVTYNELHLVYIALFSTTLFALAIFFTKLDFKRVKEHMEENLPYRGIYIFLVFTGIALIVAWLPDIITSLVNDRSLAVIEVYTTEITHVLDIGIIGPLAFVNIYLLMKREAFGYILLSMMLSLCSFVGIMVIIQTIFQIEAGVDLPLPVMITKAASFVLLALFAMYYNIKLFKQIKP